MDNNSSGIFIYKKNFFLRNRLRYRLRIKNIFPHAFFGTVGPSFNGDLFLALAAIREDVI